MPAILATIFNSITLILLGVLGALEVSKKASHLACKKVLWGALAISVVLSLIFQFSAAFHEQTYKNDLVLRYQDRFEDKLASERSEAAAAITEYLQKGNWDAVTNQDGIDSMEDVLGFFDELGFYWKHGEISSDVLYEHFYNDMRTYCQATMGYIHENQKAESKADWEYAEPLFNELTRIEAKRNGMNVTNCIWDMKTLRDNLKSEMRLRGK